MKCEVCGKIVKKGYERLPVQGENRRMTVCRKCCYSPDVMIDTNKKGEVTGVRKPEVKDLQEIVKGIKKCFTPWKMEVQLDLDNKKVKYREWVRIPKRYRKGSIKDTKLVMALSGKLLKEMGIKQRSFIRETEAGVVASTETDHPVILLSLFFGEFVPALIHKCGVTEKFIMSRLKQDLKATSRLWKKGAT